jgi:pimeloyl-ACP methyl ester carboxylesterase
MFGRHFNLCWRAWIALLAMATAAAYGADRTSSEDVVFTARCDNSVQNYLVIYPKAFKADESHHLLILLHGHGSDRWQAVDNSVDEFRAGRDSAVARNMLVVSPDYRARTSWMGPKAEADLLQIIDELKVRFRIGKTILAGASMGGSSALTFAALHPALVDGLVSMNGTANHFEYENFQDAIRKSFGGDKSVKPLEYKNRSAEYWPERFTMPIGITASGKDKTVPAASVLRLANVIKKLQPDKVLLIYREEAGHNTSYEDSKTAFEFVLKKLDSSPVPERTLQTAK